MDGREIPRDSEGQEFIRRKVFVQSAPTVIGNVSALGLSARYSGILLIIGRKHCNLSQDQFHEFANCQIETLGRVIFARQLQRWIATQKDRVMRQSRAEKKSSSDSRGPRQNSAPRNPGAAGPNSRMLTARREIRRKINSITAERRLEVKRKIHRRSAGRIYVFPFRE